MAITRPTYATREQVKRAPDFKATARADGEIDDALVAAAELVETNCNDRVFYPTTGTRVFDYPQPYGRYFRLWLLPDEVISVTAVVSAGRTIAPSNYYLEPANLGPPYGWIELNLGSPSAVFDVANTPQHAVEVTGDFGYRCDTTPAGALAAPVNASDATFTVTDGSLVGVGDLLLAESERVLVTDRDYVDTGTTLTADLTASTADVGLAIATPADVHVGEQLLVDNEVMAVAAIGASTVTVRRAWDGSVLASHSTGAAVWANRRLIVQRAATGTAAAPHATVDVTAYRPPGPVQQLVIAEALVMVEQGRGAWAARTGTGDLKAAGPGVGIDGLRTYVYANYIRNRMPGVV